MRRTRIFRTTQRPPNSQSEFVQRRAPLVPGETSSTAAYATAVETKPPRSASGVDFDGLTKAEWLSHLTELASAHKRIFGRTLALTDELGELHACTLLGLNRATAGMTGYDAVDSDGRKVQIKSRSPRVLDHVNPVGRVGRFHSWDFDYALLVLMDSEYRLDAIWRADRADLEALQAKVKNPKVGVGVSAFLRMAKRVYRDQKG